MSSLVNTIQSQPLETRKMILVGVSTGVTILLVLAWILSFALSHPNTEAKQQSKARPSESPFAIIKNSVVELYANASTAADSAQNN